MDYFHSVGFLLTADPRSPPRCWDPGLQTRLSIGTDGSAETLTVPSHVTATRVVYTLRRSDSRSVLLSLSMEHYLIEVRLERDLCPAGSEHGGLENAALLG